METNNKYRIQERKKKTKKNGNNGRNGNSNMQQCVGDDLSSP